MKPSKTLVFFGSGPVAAATLRGLKQADFTFEAIITKPRAQGFRGDVPVIDLANDWNIPLFTPQNKAELSQLFAQHTFKSLVGLVVDYGIIINQDVIQAFPKGIINSHFSLLPQWRGADPITFAILSGQTETGISIMLINEKMDEGPLISQKHYQLRPESNISTLTKDLIELSNSTLTSVIPDYLAGKLLPYAQPAQLASYSRKLTKADGHVDWQKPATIIEREVRAYLGWPKSRAQLFGHEIIITKSRLSSGPDDGALVAQCNPGWLEILELKAPSGKTMTGDAFLRGYTH